jgi:assimilatory nitrate reductase catalytic subunit
MVRVQPEPRFLQAIRTFEGRGLDEYLPFDPPLTYHVPDGREAQCVYFRGGNSAGELVCVVLTRDGEPMRLFPIGARSGVHIPLRITENLLTDTQLELHMSAPRGVRGTVVLDLGILEL